MILDLLDYGSYNRKFAKLAGIQTAVYFEQMLEILFRVRDKKTYDANGFFKLDRNYVESKTTLTKEQQLECDILLKKLNLLDFDPDNKNLVRCDMKAYNKLLDKEDATEIAEITKVTKSATKEGKAEGKRIGITRRLQGRIKDLDPVVVDLYYQLIEILYDQGVQSNAQIDLMQDTLNGYTTDNKVKAEILKISIACGYRNISWSIEQYEKNHKKSSAKLGEQKKSTGVKEDVTF